jgi:hypothetical protein
MLQFFPIEYSIEINYNIILYFRTSLTLIIQNYMPISKSIIHLNLDFLLSRNLIANEIN